MKILKFLFALFIVSCISTMIVMAATITSTGSNTTGTNWTTGSAWVGGTAPASGDDVIIVSGDSIFLSAATTCNSLTIKNGAKLSLGSAPTLGMTVSSAFTIEANGWYYDNGTGSNTGGFPAPSTVSIDPASNYVHTAGGAVGGTNPNFGNLIDKSATGVYPPVDLTINGNLTIDKAGTNYLRAARTATSSRTHTVKGNVVVISGGIAGVDNSAASIVGTWNIDGNVTVKANSTSQARFIGNTTGGAGTAIFNIKGNLTTESGTNNGAVYFGSNSGITGSCTINIQGNIINNGTISKNQATSGPFVINFNGSSPQIFSGNSPVASSGVLGDLKISNASGVTLNSLLTLNDNWRVNLTTGNLNTTSTNLLTVGAGTGAGILGGGASSYVNGPISKVWAATGSFAYPVGDASNYSPVTLNFTSGIFTTASAIVQAFGIKHTSNTSTTDYINRYWNVTQSGISSFACNADFVYVDGDVVGTESNLTLGQLNTQWNVVGTCTPATNTLSAVALTSFSDFTGGEQGALPIQLASFTGSYINNSAKLEWSTISEKNNYGFNVQRLNETSKNYETVGFVAGKGTTLHSQSYSYIDEQAGTTYRLEQLDNDGLKNYFGPIYLNPNSVGDPLANGPAVFALSQNYPNPFNPTTKISFSLANAGYTTLKVYNIVGKEVASLFSGNAEAGKQYIVNFDAKNLTSGMYFYKLQNGNSVEVKKLTLVK